MQSITREDAKQMVGKGWSGLIDEAYDKFPKTVYVTDVKEKWGALRIDAFGINDVVSDFLWDLETRSTAVCEECGKPGKLRPGGWIKTLCDEHCK